MMNKDTTALYTLIARYGALRGVRLEGFRLLILDMGLEKVRAASSPSTFYRKIRDLHAAGFYPVERRTFSLRLDPATMDAREMENIGGVEAVERWNELVLASSALLDAERAGGKTDE